MTYLPPFLRRQVWPVTESKTVAFRAVYLARLLGSEFIVSPSDEEGHYMQVHHLSELASND